MSFTIGDWLSLLALGGSMLGTMGLLLLRYINMRTGDNRAFFEREMGEMDTKIGGVRSLLELYRDQLQQHQIEVAKNYVRNERLGETEGRILARFDRLEAKLDRQYSDRHN